MEKDKKHRAGTLFGRSDQVAEVRQARLRWLGHLERMLEERVIKKLYQGNLGGGVDSWRDVQGRDRVDEDLRRVGVRMWRILSQDRELWKLWYGSKLYWSCSAVDDNDNQWGIKIKNLLVRILSNLTTKCLRKEHILVVTITEDVPRPLIVSFLNRAVANLSLQVLSLFLNLRIWRNLN